MFVFEHFEDHLLELAQKDLPLEVKNKILEDALREIAELHDQDIVHTDMKADNCLYAVHKHIIFAVGEEELDERVDPLAIVIERQISYFGDDDTLNVFLNLLGDNPWVPVSKVLRDGFNKDNPRKPFSLWKGVDEDFKCLICAMTNFDPENRITAREALAHKWFEDV
ncbi:hypothetical protein NUU61_003255 [Penicillium alfredii]|uniref:Protein kinase domain-containing protein n=1 Tax=Penicillium alfredii TaxID=1506179 RepID=A0A9W9FT46_9EURO|nr:uncharacterized protein NUU61_003255 [Penicillium alfredii]KAJ5105908.1 hypothetical protein NUU61_003255 [Penicillium alfredii]